MDDSVWSSVGSVKPEFAVVYRQTCSRPQWWCDLSQRFFGHTHIIATIDFKPSDVHEIS